MVRYCEQEYVIFRVLPLPNHQMLVGKHLRYQSKENCLSRVPLPAEREPNPQVPQPVVLAWGTAVGCIPIPSANNRLRKEHLVYAICFGIPFFFFFSLSLATACMMNLCWHMFLLLPPPRCLFNVLAYSCLKLGCSIPCTASSFFSFCVSEVIRMMRLYSWLGLDSIFL